MLWLKQLKQTVQSQELKMATGLQRLVRRALLTRLKADVGLTALVPTGSIHGQAPRSEPTWPFVKLGPPNTLPIRAACVNGATVTTSVHAFARDREDEGAVVETAEDHAGRIGAAIEALDNTRITIAEGVTARLRFTDMQLLVDGAEPQAFHYFANVQARVLA